MDRIWKSGCGERALHSIAWYSIALVLSKCYLVIGKEIYIFQMFIEYQAIEAYDHCNMLSVHYENVRYLCLKPICDLALTYTL